MKTIKFQFEQTDKKGLMTSRTFEVDVKDHVPFEAIRADIHAYLFRWINRQRTVGKYGMKFNVPVDIEFSVDGSVVNSTKIMRAKVAGFEEGIKLGGMKREKCAKFLRMIDILMEDYEDLCSLGSKVDRKLTVGKLAEQISEGQRSVG